MSRMIDSETIGLVDVKVMHFDDDAVGYHVLRRTRLSEHDINAEWESIADGRHVMDVLLPYIKECLLLKGHLKEKELERQPTRYEIGILVHDSRDPEAVAEAVLAVLPENASASIREVGDEKEDPQEHPAT